MSTGIKKEISEIKLSVKVGLFLVYLVLGITMLGTAIMSLDPSFVEKATSTHTPSDSIEMFFVGLIMGVFYFIPAIYIAIKIYKEEK